MLKHFISQYYRIPSLCSIFPHCLNYILLYFVGIRISHLFILSLKFLLFFIFLLLCNSFLLSIYLLNILDNLSGRSSQVLDLADNFLWCLQYVTISICPVNYIICRCLIKSGTFKNTVFLLYHMRGTYILLLLFNDETDKQVKVVSAQSLRCNSPNTFQWFQWPFVIVPKIRDLNRD